MRVTVGDIELYVHVRGEGRALVALHGGPGLDGSVWFPALEPVAEDGWWVLAPDLRGNGLSGGDDPSAWTVSQMADDVELLLRELDLSEPVVMGWSFGSIVTQSHMARHGSAAAYVLMGTIASPDAVLGVHERLAAFEPVSLRAQVTASWDLEATVQTAEECKQLLADQMPFHFADPQDPRIAELLAADRVVYRADVLRHFAAGGEYGMVDQRPALASFNRPVLVLSGAHDRTTPAASARELVDVIPGAEEVVFSESAHMIPYEEPAAFHAALRDFLQRV